MKSKERAQGIQKFFRNNDCKVLNVSYLCMCFIRSMVNSLHSLMILTVFSGMSVWPISEIGAGPCHIRTQCATLTIPRNMRGLAARNGIFDRKFSEPRKSWWQTLPESSRTLFQLSREKVKLFSLLMNRPTFSSTAPICCGFFFTLSSENRNGFCIMLVYKCVLGVER